MRGEQDSAGVDVWIFGTGYGDGAGLAEPLLARRENEGLAGQLLRVVTVHVAERRAGDARSLASCIARDALGADLPSLRSPRDRPRR